MNEDFNDFNVGDLNVGEVFERGQWVRGEQEVSTAIKALFGLFIAAEKARLVCFGPIAVEVLALDDKRCPEPPVGPCLDGPYTGMVVAYAEVKQLVVPSSFLESLSVGDLGSLRQVVRAEHQRTYPWMLPITDIECNEMIDKLGPGAAEKSIQRSIDSQTRH